MFKTLKTLALAAVLMPLQLLAQFSLTGNVIDKENHEALIGAHISVKELELVTVSDEFGNFKFENIQKGSYTIEATYVGFKIYETIVNINKDIKVKIAMTMDSMMEEEIIVSASRIGEKTPLTYSEVTSKELKKSNQGAD